MVENVSSATLVLANQTRSHKRDRRKLYRVAHGLTLSEGIGEVKVFFNIKSLLLLHFLVQNNQPTLDELDHRKENPLLP